jgi:hypothetical protein
MVCACAPSQLGQYSAEVQPVINGEVHRALKEHGVVDGLGAQPRKNPYLP